MLALVLAGCGGGGDGGDRVPVPQTTAVQDRELDFGLVETVAEGLEVPWAIALAGDDTILLTERPGRIRIVEGGRLRPEPVAELDVVASGESGLLGLALHPDFPDERVAVVYYTGADGNRISRFRVGRDFSFTDERVLVDGISAASFHDGGFVAFGPDGTLYATTGDAGAPEQAADRGSLAGKILRVSLDGDARVHSYGHRNPQGVAWDEDGRMFATEHGPSGELGLCCHDELNRIEEGSFYGWPFRAGEVDTGAGEAPAEPVPPIATSGDETWAPGGIAAHRGSLYVATLRGERLLRFSPEGGEPETVLDGLGRLRAVAVGPDGCLYLTTSNRDGRGNPVESDDRLLRAC